MFPFSRSIVEWWLGYHLRGQKYLNFKLWANYKTIVLCKIKRISIAEEVGILNCRRIGRAVLRCMLSQWAIRPVKVKLSCSHSFACHNKSWKSSFWLLKLRWSEIHKQCHWKRQPSFQLVLFGLRTWMFSSECQTFSPTGVTGNSIAKFHVISYFFFRMSLVFNFVPQKPTGIK